jgi:PilZ domain-containing protein
MDKGDERRLRKRWRTVLKGQVVLNNRSSVLDCSVRNPSDIGANLVFADVFLLPQDFELEISSRNLRVQARLIWSRGPTHGVMFVHPEAAST